MRGLKDQAIIWLKWVRLPERHSEEAEERCAPAGHRSERDGYYRYTPARRVVGLAKRRLYRRKSKKSCGMKDHSLPSQMRL